MSNLTVVDWHTGPSRLTFAADGAVRVRVNPEDDLDAIIDFAKKVDVILADRDRSLRGKTWVDAKDRLRVKLFGGTNRKKKLHSSHVLQPESGSVQSYPSGFYA